MTQDRVPFDVSWLRLIAITDSLHDGIAGLSSRAVEAVRGGATMIQLRLPEEPPRRLVEVARALRAILPDVPLLVSDRADVALAAGAQGVHLAIHEMAPASLRRIVPEGFVIGASVGIEDDITRAAGADYACIGPVYSARRNEDALGIAGFAELAKRFGGPAIAIGGVNADNVAALMSAGAAGVAVISAVFRSPDAAAAARALRAAQDASET